MYFRSRALLWTKFYGLRLGFRQMVYGTFYELTNIGLVDVFLSFFILYRYFTEVLESMDQKQATNTIARFSDKCASFLQVYGLWLGFRLVIWPVYSRWQHQHWACWCISVFFYRYFAEVLESMDQKQATNTIARFSDRCASFLQVYWSWLGFRQMVYGTF